MLFACSSEQSTSQNDQASNLKQEAAIPTAKKVALPADDPYRNENWRPEDGNYFFSEQWTFEYFNETLTENDKKRKGEFALYVDPFTGTLLVEKNAANFEDEMTEWIIVQPNGPYLLGYTDEHGKKKIDQKELNELPDYDFNISQQAKDFKTYFNKQAKIEAFGADKYNKKAFEGNLFIQSFPKTTDQAKLFLAEMPHPVRPFYLLPTIFDEIRLPIQFPNGYVLPENALVLKEDYEYGGKKIGYSLKSISPTSYFLNTASFTINH
jgi:hypothetical protein